MQRFFIIYFYFIFGIDTILCLQQTLADIKRVVNFVIKNKNDLPTSGNSAS